MFLRFRNNAAPLIFLRPNHFYSVSCSLRVSDYCTEGVAQPYLQNFVLKNCDQQLLRCFCLYPSKQRKIFILKMGLAWIFCKSGFSHAKIRTVHCTAFKTSFLGMIDNKLFIDAQGLFCWWIYPQKSWPTILISAPNIQGNKRPKSIYCIHGTRLFFQFLKLDSLRVTRDCTPQIGARHNYSPQF